MRRFAAFDWLTNNADRKGGHVLQANDGHLWGIDHGLTLHVEEKLRTVIWDYAGERLPAPWLQDIAALLAQLEGENTLSTELGRYLLPEEMETLRERGAAIVREPILPAPPDWRRPYPWPLI